MKKIVILTLLLTLLLTSMAFAHEGNLDKYEGHYIQKEGKVVGYHYHSGDNAGWYVKFIYHLKWEDREKLNKFKPFKPQTTLKTGWKYLYDKCDWGYSEDLIVTPTPTITTEPTDTPTVEPTVSVEPTTTETVGTEEPSIEPTSTPTIEPTKEPSEKPAELPKTGEGNPIFFVVVGIICITLASILFIRAIKIYRADRKLK